MIVRIRHPVFIALTLPQVKIFMHLMQVVEHMTQAFILRVVAYLIFMGSHWLSHFTPLTPVQVGRQTRNLAVTLELSASVI